MTCLTRHCLLYVLQIINGQGEPGMGKCEEYQSGILVARQNYPCVAVHCLSL